MRLLITIAVVSLALSCHARPADDDYAYEDDAPAEPAPAPAPKAPARHALVGSRTARGPSPLIGSRGVKTTAAPPKPAEPEVVNEPEDVNEEAAEEIEEAPAVTTEAPKKGLSRGGVRPFRSNQDLLAALKRKRQQEHWRVVYEYLYVRFGYPVNLHHQLDLSPDLETEGGVSDARSEINEVTSGDNDPPPKLKPGDHELVTEKITDNRIKVNPVTVTLVKNDTFKINDEPVKIDLIQVEPVREEHITVEPVKQVKIKVDPFKVVELFRDKPVKEVEPVKVEQFKDIEVFRDKLVKGVEPIKVDSVKVEQFKVIEVFRDKPVKEVEPAKVNPPKVDQFKVIELFRDKPVKNVEVRVEQSKLESTKTEPRVDPVKIEPVKRETVKVDVSRVEPVEAAESVKIETISPVETQNFPLKVEQLNGTTVFTSSSYSVSYS